LATFFFFGLLVISRISYIKNQFRWTNQRITIPLQLQPNLLKTTSIILFAIILLAWTIPAMAKSISALHKAWQPFHNNLYKKNERFKNLFASLNTTGLYESVYFGDNTLLGDQAPESDAIIFTATSEIKSPNTRIYWSAHSYDSYSNGEWKSSVGETKEYNPVDFEIEIADNKQRSMISFNIYGNIPLTTLFLPSEPLWINYKGLINYIEYPDGTSDIISFHAQHTLNPGETYVVYASIENASVEALRQTSTNYPEWIIEKYLKLPDNISERVTNLAQEITQDKNTAYDKTIAITNFLRDNISYSNSIPTSPKNVEPIDWFLFDYQKGFCNYYATAEVLLLRSIGIPAKFSLGYSEGESNQNGTYIVRQRNTHAWPEVFFPGIGWVIFEPTSSQPQIIRTPYNASQPQIFDDQSLIELEKKNLDREIDSGSLQSNTINLKSKKSFISLIISLSVLIGTISLLVYIFVQIKNKIKLIPLPIIVENSFKKAGINTPKMVTNWAAIARLSPTKKAYLQINNALKRQDYQIKPYETPIERTNQLRSLMPAADKYLSILIREYQKETYYHQQPNASQAVFAGKRIKQISRSVFLKKIFPFNKLPIDYRKT
jgi:transglutaminase-like putative cysteine protease